MTTSERVAEAIADRWLAGERIASIGEDYDLSQDKLEGSLRTTVLLRLRDSARIAELVDQVGVAPWKVAPLDSGSIAFDARGLRPIPSDICRLLNLLATGKENP